MVVSILKTDKDIQDIYIGIKEKLKKNVKQFYKQVKATISFKDYESCLISYEKLRKKFLKE